MSLQEETKQKFLITTCIFHCGRHVLVNPSDQTSSTVLQSLENGRRCGCLLPKTPVVSRSKLIMCESLIPSKIPMEIYTPHQTQ